MTGWSFYRRMPVYLANGRRFGRVVEVGHALDVLHVEQGRLLVRDWYVPASAIRDVTADGVLLDVALEDLRRQRWNVPPEAYLARQGATPGYEYTGPVTSPMIGSALDPALASETGKVSNG